MRGLFVHWTENRTCSQPLDLIRGEQNIGIPGSQLPITVEAPAVDGASYKRSTRVLAICCQNSNPWEI